MWKNWFRRQNPDQLKNIEQRLVNMEEALDHISHDLYRNQIHIDALNVHIPDLKNIDFRLDQLDIDEVSGALNLGNNFGVRVHPKVRIKRYFTDDSGEVKQSENENSEQQQPAEDGPSLHKTASGFSYRFTPK